MVEETCHHDLHDRRRVVSSFSCRFSKQRDRSERARVDSRVTMRPHCALYIRLGEALGCVAHASSPSCDCRLEWLSHCSRIRVCYGGTSLAMHHRASRHGSFRISLLGVARAFEGGKGDRRRDCSNNCAPPRRSPSRGGFNGTPRFREQEKIAKSTFS